MTPQFKSPVFLQSGDDFCDTVMQALRCNGAAPSPISTGALSMPTGSRAWRAARETALRGTTHLSPTKWLTAACHHAGTLRKLREHEADLVYLWRGMFGRAALGADAARALGIPCVFFEGGPIRGWVQIDMQGVNARSSIPRNRTFFHLWRTEFGLRALDWRTLEQTMTTATPKRAGVAQRARSDWAGVGNFLFCPFQVNRPGDPLPDGGWVSDAADLMAALAQASRALRKGWHLRLKPHPNARGDLVHLAARHPDARLVIDAETNSLDQLRASQGVITVNSAMGLEAFFADKPVITLGDTYYGGLGRTQTASSVTELANLLADPLALGFDQEARDDLMAFLFNDFFVPVPRLQAGGFDIADLVQRHARHQEILARAVRQS